MKMYKTWYGHIDEHEVIKISESSIWFKGVRNVSNKGVITAVAWEDRELLETSQYKWHKTHQLAKQHLIDAAELEVRRLKSQLHEAHNKLNKLRKL